MSDIKNQISDLFDNLSPDDKEIISEEMNIQVPPTPVAPKPVRVVEERDTRIPIRGPIKRQPQSRQPKKVVKESVQKKAPENYFDKLIEKARGQIS